MSAGTETTAAPTVRRTFSAATLAELDKIKSRYPTKRAALLPGFRLAEKEFGCVDFGAMKLLADLLDLTPAYVWSVFSFYTHYRRPTDGKYVIEVCRTLPCALRGADAFAAHCSKKLGIKPGETTKDGKYTLKDAECQAACDLAPMVQVDARDYPQMTPEKFDRLLEELK